MRPNPKHCHVRDCHPSGAFWTVSNAFMLEGYCSEGQVYFKSRLSSLFFSFFFFSSSDRLDEDFS